MKIDYSTSKCSGIVIGNRTFRATSPIMYVY